MIPGRLSDNADASREVSGFCRAAGLQLKQHVRGGRLRHRPHLMKTDNPDVARCSSGRSMRVRRGFSEGDGR
jgi:hypothetical protein